MIETIIIAIITCVSLILSIIFFPKIKLFNKQISTYWVISLIGALLMIIFNTISIKEVLDGLLNDSSINPIKILILFVLSFYQEDFKKLSKKDKDTILHIIKYFLSNNS